MSDTRDTGKIRLLRQSGAYWRVTIDLPPLNIFGPANIPQLEEVVSSLEKDDQVKAVVFDSAVGDFSSPTTISSPSPKIPQSFPLAARDYRHCLTCSPASAAHRSCPFH